MSIVAYNLETAVKGAEELTKNGTKCALCFQSGAVYQVCQAPDPAPKGRLHPSCNLCGECIQVKKNWMGQADQCLLCKSTVMQQTMQEDPSCGLRSRDLPSWDPPEKKLEFIGRPIIPVLSVTANNLAKGLDLHTRDLQNALQAEKSMVNDGAERRANAVQAVLAKKRLREDEIGAEDSVGSQKRARTEESIHNAELREVEEENAELRSTIATPETKTKSARRPLSEEQKALAAEKRKQTAHAVKMYPLVLEQVEKLDEELKMVNSVKETLQEQLEEKNQEIHKIRDEKNQEIHKIRKMASEIVREFEKVGVQREVQETVRNVLANWWFDADYLTVDEQGIFVQELDADSPDADSLDADSNAEDMEEDAPEEGLVASDSDSDSEEEEEEEEDSDLEESDGEIVD